MNWLTRIFGQTRASTATRSAACLAPSTPTGPNRAVPTFPVARAARHLDGDEQRLVQLSPARQNALIKIGKRVREGSLSLPGMSSTSMQAVKLVQSEQVDLREVVDLVEQDPVLSGEILRTANSALFAARSEVDSVQAAAVRLGVRRLRDVILGVSMRSSIFRDRTTVEHAKEIWRQAISVASIARAIAPRVGIDAESGYSMGLLADIGRVPLLACAAKGLTGDESEDHSFLSKLFFLYHEAVGASMARAWDLPEDLVAVAARHHRFHENETAPREAARVSRAHRADGCLSAGDRSRFLELVDSDELRFLEADPDGRRDHLNRALETYLEVHPETLPTEEAESDEAA